MTLMVKVASSSEKSVSTYKATQCHNPEDHYENHMKLLSYKGILVQYIAFCSYTW
jgi:hypothetical protein